MTSLLAACCFAVAIDAHAIRAHVKFLADDLLEGRGTATRGHEIAAAYIAAQFDAAGLETSLQQVPLRRATLDPSASRVELIAADGTATPLVAGRDYIMRATLAGAVDVTVRGSEQRHWTAENEAIVRSSAALPMYGWQELESGSTVWLAPSVQGHLVHIVNKSRVEAMQSPNVIGVVRGETSEYVVVTAHADHLGISDPVNGDAIYNGVVDNASGVAALIELARAFAAMKERPRRSLMFIAFTAEEPGSVGSDYFAHHPTVPLESIIANVNIDGASMWPYDTLALRGPEHALFRDAVAASGLTVAPDPFPDRFSGSDQYSFHQRGVPAVIVTAIRSGAARALALDWYRTRYHQPSDDLAQPLDYDACARFTSDVFRFLSALATGGRASRPPGASCSMLPGRMPGRGGRDARPPGATSILIR